MAVAVSLVGLTLLGLAATHAGDTTRNARSRTPPGASTSPSTHAFNVASPTALTGVSKQPSEILSIQITADRSTVACPAQDVAPTTQYVTFTASIHVVASRSGSSIAGAFSGTSLAASLVAASAAGWVATYPIPPNATTISVHYQLALPPNAADGMYGVQFAASDPNHHASRSNTATVTKRCTG